MRSSTLVLTIGLLATPFALLANPPPGPTPGGSMQLAQNSAVAPQQSINGRPLLDAPTGGPLPGVAPVDRAGGPGSPSLTAGPVNATPFAAGPTSNYQAGSPGTPNGTPGGLATPNLGR